jgi:hypothetical protein
MKLYEIAHSRTGDKGNISNISVIALNPKHFAHLSEHVTVEKVSQHFSEIIKGEVIRYVLPKVGALNFVLKRSCGEGVTQTLALDAHGKCLSSALLNLEIPNP